MARCFQNVSALNAWLATLFAASSLAACAVDPIAARTYCFEEGSRCSKAQCAAAGGTMQYSTNFIGDVHYHFCTLPARDAGKACHDSSECENTCLAVPGKAGQPATGRCGEHSNVKYRCSEVVRNGIVGHSDDYDDGCNIVE